MQKTITLAVAIACTAISAFAQSFNVGGTIKDNTDKPVPAATISLLKAIDSSWVKSELTEENGHFNLKEVAKGDYILAITALGYNEAKETITINNKDLAVSIVLNKTSNALKEVVVIADKPFIEREAGKTIVNVTTEKAAGNNVLDLMRKLPGLTVGGNGNISMSGKQGVLVMINGKQTYLNGEELANYLKSMTAEQVAQIEIISQPGAKYEAEGNSGIVNIKTRKNKKEGLSGTASATFSKTRYEGTSENLQVSYKKNKTALMANLGYFNRAGYLEQEVDRNFLDKNTYEVLTVEHQNSYWKERFKDYSIGLDAEHEINNKTIISAQVKGIYHPNSEQDESQTSFTNLAQNTATFNSFKNQRDFVRVNYSTNAQLTKKFNDKNELVISADHMAYDIINKQDMVNTNYNTNLKPVPGGLILKGELPTDMAVSGAKVDYTGTWGKTKIEAGAKSSLLAIEAGVFLNVNDNGVWKYDSVRNNNFLYKENINSVYVSGARTFGEKIDTKAGLRAEHTNVEGLQEVGNIGFERNYLSLFPTAYINYKPNDKYNFGLNYGRRVERPSYRQMNPYIEFTSQYNSRTGNPKLKPQYAHSIELTGDYKNMLNCNLSYRNVTDIINNVAKQDASTYSYYVMPDNIAKFTEVQFALTFNKALYKWWEVSATAYAFELYYDGIYNGQVFRDKGPGLGFYTSGDLSFAHQWKASYWLTGQARSRESSIVTSDSNLYYGFSVSKKTLWRYHNR